MQWENNVKMMKKWMSRLMISLMTVMMCFACGGVKAEEVQNGWDEADRVHYLTRNIPTAVNVYAKGGQSDALTHEQGMIDGVIYDILRVRPDSNHVVQVDYSQTPVSLSQLYDQNMLNQGYVRAGGINAGYFQNSESQYGKPVGAVRRNNAWTTWQGEENTPSYGNGFATAYITNGKMSLKYHGWSGSIWRGDGFWNWFSGYSVNEDFGISGSYTYYADGQQKDITNGAYGSVNYRTYGRAVTILAQKADQQFLLITIYGTLSEDTIKNFLGRLNVYNAIRMDGGQSTQMVYDTSVVKNVNPELSDTYFDEAALNNPGTQIGSVTVTTNGLRIRSSASLTASIKGRTTGGKTYPVYETATADNYTWYRIGVNQWIAGNSGWTSYSGDTADSNAAVSASAQPAGTPASQPAEAASSSSTVTILVNRLILRQEPSVSSKKLGYAEKGKTYAVYESQSSGGYTWYRIGDNQWIAGKDGWTQYNGNAASAAQPSAAPQASVSSDNTVKVLVSRLILRQGPSVSSKKLGYAEKGKTYAVYESQSSGGYTWYRIGDNQWIAGKDGWTQYNGTASAPASSSSAIGKVNVLVTNLVIRQGPSVSSKKLGHAVKGKTYDVYESKDAEGYTWYRIGENQWIAGKDTWTSYQSN